MHVNERDSRAMSCRVRRLARDTNKVDARLSGPLERSHPNEARPQLDDTGGLEESGRQPLDAAFRGARHSW